MLIRDVIEFLSRPTADGSVRSRQGSGGKNFDYIEFPTVVHRLNAMSRVFGLGWDWTICDTREIGSTLVMVGQLAIERVGCRQGVGVQAMEQGGRQVNEDLLKGAESDALKRAATKFGVGLDLYNVQDEEVKVVGAFANRDLADKAARGLVTIGLLSPVFASGKTPGRSEALEMAALSHLKQAGLDADKFGPAEAEILVGMLEVGPVGAK